MYRMIFEIACMMLTDLNFAKFALQIYSFSTLSSLVVSFSRKYRLKLTIIRIEDGFWVSVDEKQIDFDNWIFYMWSSVGSLT